MQNLRFGILGGIALGLAVWFVAHQGQEKPQTFQQFVERQCSKADGPIECVLDALEEWLTHRRSVEDD